MRSALIVIDAPGFDLGFRVVDRGELMGIQALVPQASVERLDEGICRGFPGPNEIGLTATLIRPVLGGRDVNSVP